MSPHQKHASSFTPDQKIRIESASTLLFDAGLSGAGVHAANYTAAYIEYKEGKRSKRELLAAERTFKERYNFYSDKNERTMNSEIRVAKEDMDRAINNILGVGIV